MLSLFYNLQIAIGHTRSSQSARVFTNRYYVAATNGGRSPCSGFPNCPRPQLPASHSNSSQQLNPSGYLTDCNFNPVNCCWPSPAQSFLLSGLVGTYDHIFVLCIPLRVSKWGLCSDERRGLATAGHTPTNKEWPAIERLTSPFQ
jgi:hypothetical protein